MAFLNRVHGVLKQSISASNLGGLKLGATNSSLFQAIRSMSSSKLFVRGLSYNMDQDTLASTFGQYGDVVEARIITDHETGRSKGFGFVTYTSTEAASSANQALDGQSVHMNQVVSNPPQSCNLFVLLRHFTDNKSVPAGKSLHTHFFKTGEILASSILSNAILNFYGKCHLFSEARLFFEEIPNKDAVTWNILINNYSQLGLAHHSHSALQLSKQMLRQQTLPNSHTFSGIFSAAAVLLNPVAARQVHCLVTKLVHPFDVFVYSSLLNVYRKLGLLEDGRKVFDEMPVRNSITWSTMVSDFASQRMANQAVEIFRMMVGRGEEDVNKFVLTSVLSVFTAPEFSVMGKQIHCLAIKNGLLEIIFVGNAVVTMYSKCGSLDKAVLAFGFSNNKNPITWSAIITGCAQSGENEKALVLFEEMHSCGMKPTEYTFVGVLKACSDRDALTIGKQVHGYLMKSGFWSQIYIMTALVDVYAKCCCIIEVQKGFDCLHEPDLVLWISMIGGFVQNGENQGAFNLYWRMQVEGIPPNELTMASVLKACSGLFSLEQGKQVHVHVVKYGFNLEVPIGSALSTMHAKYCSLDDGNAGKIRGVMEHNDFWFVSKWFRD